MSSKKRATCACPDGVWRNQPILILSRRGDGRWSLLRKEPDAYFFIAEIRFCPFCGHRLGEEVKP